MTQRSGTEVISLILESAKAGATKTALMYGAYLSFDGLREYLALLRKKGLIEFLVGEMKFKTTPKGRAFLTLHFTDDPEACSHQCRRRGVLYDCEQSRCKDLFQYGVCNNCVKFFSPVEVQTILQRT